MAEIPKIPESYPATTPDQAGSSEMSAVHNSETLYRQHELVRGLLYGTIPVEDEQTRIANEILTRDLQIVLSAEVAGDGVKSIYNYLSETSVSARSEVEETEQHTRRAYDLSSAVEARLTDSIRGFDVMNPDPETVRRLSTALLTAINDAEEQGFPAIVAGLKDKQALIDRHVSEEVSTQARRAVHAAEDAEKATARDVEDDKKEEFMELASSGEITTELKGEMCDSIAQSKHLLKVAIQPTEELDAWAIRTRSVLANLPGGAEVSVLLQDIRYSLDRVIANPEDKRARDSFLAELSYGVQKKFQQLNEDLERAGAYQRSFRVGLDDLDRFRTTIEETGLAG